MSPFKSQAQKRYLFAKEPAVAKEFAAKTPKKAKLPEKVTPKRDQPQKRGRGGSY